MASAEITRTRASLRTKRRTPPAKPTRTHQNPETFPKSSGKETQSFKLWSWKRSKSVMVSSALLVLSLSPGHKQQLIQFIVSPSPHHLYSLSNPFLAIFQKKKILSSILSLQSFFIFLPCQNSIHRSYSKHIPKIGGPFHVAKQY